MTIGYAEPVEAIIYNNSDKTCFISRHDEI